jgi:hypothetical protein
MKNTQKGAIVPILAVLAVIALVVGTYFYLTSQDKELRDQVAQVQIMRQQLAVSQAQAAAEESKLSNLKSKYTNGGSVQAAIFTQYQNTVTAINKTDVFFNNPDSASPKINIATKTTSIQDDINNRRKQINDLLSDWRKEADITQTKVVDKNTVIKVEKDAQIIEQYVAELAKIVDSLTPGDTSLSQTQIDTYQALLVEVKKEITTTITALVQAESIKPPVVVDTTNPNNTPPVNQVPPPVTADQIAAQAQAAADAQAKVDAIQAALDALLAQIPPASLPPDTGLPPDTSGSSTPPGGDGLPPPDSGSGTVPVFDIILNPFGTESYNPNLKNPNAPQPIQGVK